jgi:hypothetical protein
LQLFSTLKLFLFKKNVDEIVYWPHHLRTHAASHHLVPIKEQ